MVAKERKIILLLGVVILVSVFVGGFFIVRSYLMIGTSALLPGESISLRKPAIDQMLSTTVEYRVETVAKNLFVPWDMVFTSDDRMLVTERSGQIRIFAQGVLSDQPLISIPEVSSSDEEGLMGITLHPEYATNKLFYVCYAYTQGDGLADKVVEIRDDGETAVVVKTIIEDIPAAQFHAGCALRFGPDGKLYITTGDATQRQIAQDLDSLGGKILRINVDGSIPSDNPFPDSPVYSYGHRNPQGIDWHPEFGFLIETEHGPSGFDGPGGGDEVNRIEAGKNYGWPIVSHEKTQAGLVDPLLVFTPAEAPGSGEFYTGSVFPQFQGSYLFGALRGEGIIQVDFNELGEVTDYEKLSGIEVGRVRAVVTGPDGLLYFTSSNRDGRGSVKVGDDKVYRLVPKK